MDKTKIIRQGLVNLALSMLLIVLIFVIYYVLFLGIIHPVVFRKKSDVSFDVKKETPSSAVPSTSNAIKEAKAWYTVSSDCPKGTDEMLRSSKVEVELDVVKCSLPQSDPGYIYKGKKVKVWLARYAIKNYEDVSFSENLIMLQTGKGVLVQDPMDTTHIPFDYSYFFKGEKPFDPKATYTDPSKTYTVSFLPVQYCGGCSEGASPLAYVGLVNNKRTADAGGNVGVEAISQVEFSKFGPYFAYRGRSTGSEGCIRKSECQTISLFVFDLKKLTGTKLDLTTYISNQKEWLNDKRKAGDIMSVVDSYKWINSNILEVHLFYVQHETATGGYYKISPTEVWNYEFDRARFKQVGTIVE